MLIFRILKYYFICLNFWGFFLIKDNIFYKYDIYMYVEMFVSIIDDIEIFCRG